MSRFESAEALIVGPENYRTREELHERAVEAFERMDGVIGEVKNVRFKESRLHPIGSKNVSVAVFQAEVERLSE